MKSHASALMNIGAHPAASETHRGSAAAHPTSEFETSLVAATQQPEAKAKITEHLVDRSLSASVEKLASPAAALVAGELPQRADPGASLEQSIIQQATARPSTPAPRGGEATFTRASKALFANSLPSRGASEGFVGEPLPSSGASGGLFASSLPSSRDSAVRDGAPTIFTGMGSAVGGLDGLPSFTTRTSSVLPAPSSPEAAATAAPGDGLDPSRASGGSIGGVTRRGDAAANGLSFATPGASSREATSPAALSGLHAPVSPAGLELNPRPVFTRPSAGSFVRPSPAAAGPSSPQTHTSTFEAPAHTSLQGASTPSTVTASPATPAKFVVSSGTGTPRLPGTIERSLRGPLAPVPQPRGFTLPSPHSVGSPRSSQPASSQPPSAQVLGGQPAPDQEPTQQRANGLPIARARDGQQPLGQAAMGQPSNGLPVAWAPGGQQPLGQAATRRAANGSPIARAPSGQPPLPQAGTEQPAHGRPLTLVLGRQSASSQAPTAQQLTQVGPRPTFTALTSARDANRTEPVSSRARPFSRAQSSASSDAAPPAAPQDAQAPQHAGAPHLSQPVTRFDTSNETVKGSSSAASAHGAAGAHASAKSSALGALEAMGVRSKAMQQTQRVSTSAVGANGSPPVRSRASAAAQAELAEKKKPADKLEAAAAAPLNQLFTNKEPALVFQAPELAPAVLPQLQKAFEPLMPQMIDDASLRVALLPHSARVSLETPESGRVSMHLKVNNGVAEIQASGPAAPALEARQNELRVALAQEGLALGHFDLTQSHTGGNQNPRDDRSERSEPTSSTRAAARSSTSSEVALGEGRVHVKA